MKKLMFLMAIFALTLVSTGTEMGNGNTLHARGGATSSGDMLGKGQETRNSRIAGKGEDGVELNNSRVLATAQERGGRTFAGKKGTIDTGDLRVLASGNDGGGSHVRGKTLAFTEVGNGKVFAYTEMGNGKMIAGIDTGNNRTLG